MYNWIIINIIGFFTGIISSICVNFICKKFYPIIYEHYYWLYVTIQVSVGCYMGSRVCQWYVETRHRYDEMRRGNMISSNATFWYLPIRMGNKSQCIKKINDVIMD